MIYFYWIFAFVLNATANIMLKIGARQGLSFQDFNLFFFLKENVFFVTGALLFALSMVFYFLTLRVLPISIVYPVLVSMSIVLTNLIAYFYLHENINKLQIIGYIFIIIGIALVFIFGYKQM